jgi:jouberin
LDLKETVINEIMLFPREKKLLVHSRDNTIRIIDLKSGCILQWLRGLLNKRYRTFCSLLKLITLKYKILFIRLQIFCTISPCGTYIFSGSENGFLHVWNSKSGHEVAVYTPFSLEQQFLTIHCVDFHPYENMLGISHYGKKMSLLLYCFDKNIEQPTIDVTFKDNELNRKQNFEISKKPKLKESVKNKLNKNDEKFDFKAILQKMDTLITFQKP